MIDIRSAKLVAISVAFLVLLGCARSQTPNYYLLNPVSTSAAESAASCAAQPPGPTVGVGPVKVPEYLDRPQMVTRSSDTSLRFSEYDRWAEPLGKNLARVVADDLSAMLPSENVCVFPWTKSMQVRYQVTLDVVQLEQTPDGKVTLDARWNIMGDEGSKLLVMKRSRLVLPVESSGFDAIAAAESRAVEGLSREIADSIRSLGSVESR